MPYASKYASTRDPPGASRDDTGGIAAPTSAQWSGLHDCITTGTGTRRYRRPVTAGRAGLAPAPPCAGAQNALSAACAKVIILTLCFGRGRKWTR